MPCHRPYRPFPTRPHTYGVRPWSCPAIATEPCRPAACVRERPCSHNGQDGLGKTPSYRASAPNGAGDVGSRATVHCSLLTVHWSYTFSAKERDSETGLSYFGSRYYSSDLSIWLSVDPQSDKYASLSPYTYCANNPVKLVDPNGEEFGDFIFNGTIIGTDGIDDGLLYVVKNYENKNCDDAVEFILNHSGNTQDFAENSIAYENSILIESSAQNRQAMIDIVSKDNGLGGTADANNREYGGIIKDGKVIPLEPGAVGKLVLGKKNYLLFPGEATFHSHASGDTDVPNIDNTVTTISNGKPYACWEQKPSQIDIDNAGNSTHYVFAMREKVVYIYNSSGIQATMPMNRFVKPHKIKRR